VPPGAFWPKICSEKPESRENGGKLPIRYYDAVAIEPGNPGNPIKKLNHQSLRKEMSGLEIMNYAFLPRDFWLESQS